MIDVHKYRVFVEPLVERLGGGFIAYAPELPGCMSDGETPQEALESIYDAIECWLEVDDAQQSIRLRASAQAY